MWIGGSGWPVLTTSVICGGSGVTGGDGWLVQTLLTKVQLWDVLAWVICLF